MKKKDINFNYMESKEEEMKRIKNGFTLIELIAVIALLSILVTIAITSISSIKGRVNNRRYDQLSSVILLAAERFSADTGAKIVFVQTLVNEGLVETDNEDGEVIDPRNKRASLNCQKVVIDEKGNYLTDDDNAACDEEIIKNSQISIKYKAEGKEPQAFVPGKWLNESIILLVAPTEGSELKEEFEKGNVKYRWITPLAPDDVQTDPTIEVNKANISDLYRVTIEVNGVEYYTDQEVKIDKIAPVVSDFYISNPDSWSPEKELRFKITDQGSGIKRYGFSSGNEEGSEPREWTEYNGEKSIDEKITKDLSDIITSENQELYIWTEDIAGNKSANENILAGNKYELKIDTEGADGCTDDPVANETNDCPMKIQVSPDTGWVKEIALEGSAKDSNSGLVAYQFTSSTDGSVVRPTSWNNLTARTNEEIRITTSSDKNAYHYFWVKDFAGNISGVRVIVDNIDNTSPKVDQVSASNSWTNSNVTISVSGVDERKNYEGTIVSGGTGKNAVAEISKYACTQTNRRPDNISEYPYTYNKGGANTCVASENGTYYVWLIDNAGNYMLDSVTNNKVTVKIDKEKPEVSISSNETGWTKGPVTLTGTAKDPVSGLRKAWFKVGTSNDTSYTTTSDTITKTKNYSGEGSTTHQFCATDQAGNEKCSSGVQVNIDKTSPTITGVSKSSSSGSVSSVTIKFTTYDRKPTGITSISGIKEIKVKDASKGSYAVTSLGSDQYQAVVNKNSTYTITVTDNAGNTASAKTTISNIDAQAPNIGWGTSVSGPYSGSYEVYVSLSDYGSGVLTGKYCTTTGSSCTPSIAEIERTYGTSSTYFYAKIPVSTTLTPKYTVCVEATDVAGNKATACHQYDMPLEKPSITLSTFSCYKVALGTNKNVIASVDYKYGSTGTTRCTYNDGSGEYTLTGNNIRNIPASTAGKYVTVKCTARSNATGLEGTSSKEIRMTKVQTVNDLMRKAVSSGNGLYNMGGGLYRYRGGGCSDFDANHVVSEYWNSCLTPNPTDVDNYFKIRSGGSRFRIMEFTSSGIKLVAQQSFARDYNTVKDNIFMNSSIHTYLEGTYKNKLVSGLSNKNIFKTTTYRQTILPENRYKYYDYNFYKNLETSGRTFSAIFTLPTITESCYYSSRNSYNNIGVSSESVESSSCSVNNWFLYDLHGQSTYTNSDGRKYYVSQEHAFVSTTVLPVYANILAYTEDIGYMSYDGNYIRPIFYIKGDSKFTGSGTYSDPYLLWACT